MQPLFGSQIDKQRNYQLAQALIQQGSDTSPVQHPLQGLARVLQGAIGGYKSQKLEKQDQSEQAEAARIMAQALQEYKGAPAGLDPSTGITWNSPRPPDESGALAMMLSNPSTAPYGLQLQLGDIESQRNLQNKIAEAKALQPLELELARSRAQISAQHQSPTSEIRNFEYGEENPEFKDFMSSQAVRGAATISAAQKIMEENPGMTFTDAYSIAKSGLGQGVGMEGGTVRTLTGAPQASGEMAYGKEAGTEKAQIEAAFPRELAKQQATQYATADAESMALDEFDASVGRFREALAANDFTGPIAGRTGAAIADPAFTNMRSAQNELTLRAKSLLGMPSANFSDADRDFLTQISGGNYGRAEGLGQVADRLEKMSAQQKQILQAKKQRLSGQNSVGPQGQGSNPALTQPYDQIQPNVINWEDLP